MRRMASLVLPSCCICTSITCTPYSLFRTEYGYRIDSGQSPFLAVKSNLDLLGQCHVRESGRKYGHEHVVRTGKPSENVAARMLCCSVGFLGGPDRKFEECSGANRPGRCVPTRMNQRLAPAMLSILSDDYACAPPQMLR